MLGKTHTCVVGQPYLSLRLLADPRPVNHLLPDGPIGNTVLGARPVTRAPADRSFHGGSKQPEESPHQIHERTAERKEPKR
jgi:hypothetical protein